MMYWWNLSGLKALLAKGPLPETIAVRYLAIFVTFSALGTLPRTTTGPWDFLFCIWTTVAGLVGTLCCYYLNGGARGQHFLDRYLSLGFVVGLRLFPLMFLVGYLARRAEGVSGDPNHPMTLADAVSTLGMLLIFYWRLGVHTHSLRATSTGETGSKV